MLTIYLNHDLSEKCLSLIKEHINRQLLTNPSLNGEEVLYEFWGGHTSIVGADEWDVDNIQLYNDINAIINEG